MDSEKARVGTIGLQRERPVAHWFLPVACALVAIGMLGPLASYEPFHIFEEPARETTYGYEQGGWAFALLALLPVAALLIERTVPRSLMALVGFAPAAISLMISASWAGFMGSEKVLGWGVYVASMGLLLGVVLTGLGWYQAHAARGQAGSTDATG